MSRDTGAAQSLRRQLVAQGHVVDVAGDRAAALACFFEAGGHELVFLGFDLPEDEAEDLARSLQQIEATLRVL